MPGIKDDLDALKGSELQDSQAGGESGLFAGERGPQQSAQGAVGGQQLGGGAEGADFRQDGGSSGTGGYGKAQNQAFHQGQERDLSHGAADSSGDRGADFDRRQGGGRDAESVEEADRG